MADYISNSNSQVTVRRELIRGVVVDGLFIVLKMTIGADMVFEQCSDQNDLDTKLEALLDSLE